MQICPLDIESVSDAEKLRMGHYDVQGDSPLKNGRGLGWQHLRAGSVHNNWHPVTVVACSMCEQEEKEMCGTT